MEERRQRTLEEHTSLDDFLKQEGVYLEVAARSAKRVIALQIEEAMREQGLTRGGGGGADGRLSAQLDRVLDPTAFQKIVGRMLWVELR